MKKYASKLKSTSVIWAVIVFFLLLGVIFKPDQAPLFTSLFALVIAALSLVSHLNTSTYSILIEMMKRREEIAQLEGKQKNEAADYLKIKRYYDDVDYCVKDEKVELQDAKELLNYKNEKMEINILSIEINSPVETVFEFTCNPTNTSKWVPTILEEKIDTLTTSIGTVYRQKIKTTGGKVKDGAIVVTGFVKNKQLDFHSVNGTYTCKYKYETVGKGTKLTYSEEEGMDKELENPFSIEVLQKLKRLIEGDQ